jgi:hypothetical protein
MQPIEFKGHNAVLGKNQPEYLSLPAYVESDHKKTVTTCWALTPAEMDLIATTGKIWIQQLTFGRGFAPQLPSVEKPPVIEILQAIEDG